MSRDTASVIKPSFRTFAAPVEAAARRRTRSSFVSFWSLFKRIESLRDEAVGARFRTGAAAVFPLDSAHGGGMAWAARVCGRGCSPLRKAERFYVRTRRRSLHSRCTRARRAGDLQRRRRRPSAGGFPGAGAIAAV